MRVSGTCKRLAETPQLRGEPGHERLLLSVARPDQLERLFAKLLDEAEFLSPHGLRAQSAHHRDHPYVFDVEGYRASIDYQTAESTTPMFGGNSHWRGPVWFPLNYLLITRPAGEAAHPRPDRRRPPGPADLVVHRRRERTAALLQRDRADADRPRLA
jgi:hypothetical protein